MGVLFSSFLLCRVADPSADRRAPDVHQQMCTTRRPFQPPEQSAGPNIKKATNYQMRKCTAEKFLQLFRSLKCSKFQGKRKMFFFADQSRKWENSLGTNIEHMQSRCMAGGAKSRSFLAIFCSSASASLLVHVRCPLSRTLLAEPQWYRRILGGSGEPGPVL